MRQSIKFDLAESPLEGSNLIEASAGTGKTYTIAGLFLRLSLEQDLSVDRILVVTFTEAATAELKDRIRKRLKDALHAFVKGAGNEPFLQALIDKQNDRQQALLKLKDAIRDFDQVAIFTIHSFARRMLHDNAFEQKPV